MWVMDEKQMEFATKNIHQHCKVVAERQVNFISWNTVFVYLSYFQRGTSCTNSIAHPGCQGQPALLLSYYRLGLPDSHYKTSQFPQKGGGNFEFVHFKPCI